LEDASIFTAQLYAIHQALLRIQESTLHDFVIYSDFLSSLESIEQLYQTRHPLLYSYNIQGNETADKAAKAATKLQMPSDLKMYTCDLKSKIKKESLAT
jgi:hypothetical protein